MSLRCNSITGMKCAAGDDTRRESSNGSAGTDPHAAKNLRGAAIGHGGSAENGEVLRGSEGLGRGWSGESRQRGEEEEKAPGEPRTK